ncbi:MAG: hypothetical protein Ct9H90mP17_0040 [Actinomycetota bacterium]|nr:MAG: hypothetical protein Ct9H90mP17_0040 [Actinomycetota bacterium]
MQNFSSIERIAFEAAEDMHLNGLIFINQDSTFLFVNNELTPLDVMMQLILVFKNF